MLNGVMLNGRYIKLNGQKIWLPNGPRLWILGATGVGKSTLARKLFAEHEILEAGSFARAEMPDCDVDTITANAMSNLEKDPQYYAAKITRYLALHNPKCVVGCRNPLDFVMNFRASRDIALILRADGIPYRTTFEQKGLSAIHRIIEFLDEVQSCPWTGRTQFYCAFHEPYSTGDDWYNLEICEDPDAPIRN